MVARCSLDEFIERCPYEVGVQPLSKPIHFPTTGYRVPGGLLFDMRVLQGKGMQLEAPSTREGADISRDPGFAFILDSAGKKTGYHLTAHGSQHLDGTGKRHYYTIADDDFLTENLERRCNQEEGSRWRMYEPKIPYPPSISSFPVSPQKA